MVEEMTDNIKAKIEIGLGRHGKILCKGKSFIDSPELFGKELMLLRRTSVR